MEHVYEKIINLDSESQTTGSSNNEKPGEQDKEEDIAVLAEEKIELLCQDQVSPAGLVLRQRGARVPPKLVPSGASAFKETGILGVSHLRVRPLQGEGRIILICREHLLLV